MNEEVKGKKSPQLRFSGFKKIENEKLKDENWFSAPASEIFISVNDRNHPELPVLSASQELGMIYRDEGGMNIFHDVANEITYKRVKPGQFVIHLRSFQGGFAHSKVEGITSPAYTILDFKDRNKHNDLFWKYVLTSDEFIKRLELITYGIRDGRSINFSDFSTLKFHFPSYEVQQKIGAFLSHVDSLIQAKTKKLESLKAVKKSLLQKCFPKAGEKVPEMRFAGFSGDWEEKKLGEVCEINPSSNLPSVFEYVDLESVLGSEMISHRTEFKNNAPSRAQRLAKKGDVFYQTVRPYQKNNYLFELDFTNYVFSTGYAQLRPKEINSKFLMCQIQSDTFVNMVLEKCTGTSYPAINSTELSGIALLVSNDFIEQQKIGQFFSKYDSLISAQQKEIDNLKTIKKSLLQKMFV